MLNVLAIDTSTNYVVCGVVRVSLRGEVDVIAQREVDNVRGHMELLTPNIEVCLQDAGLSPTDLHCVVVGAGPGPFTGLRVGMATGAAFADACGIPLHSVASLAATAWQDVVDHPLVGSAPREVVVVADARRREWYHARYRVRPGVAGVQVECIAQPAVSRPDDVVIQEGDRVLAAAGVGESHHSDAHPTATGLVHAAIAEESSVVGLLRHVAPPRALYLRRPDAVAPKAKPVSAAVNSTAVSQADLAVSQPEAEQEAAEQDTAIKDTVQVKALNPEHAPLVAELEKKLFAEESPWSAETVRMAIATPFTSFLGLFVEEELVGYADFAVLGSAQDAECEVQNIAIAPEHQGKGLAHRLMSAMVDIAEALHAPVFLEVRTDNSAAVGLYEKYGFQVEGIRKGYYQPSGADALMMHRVFTSEPDLTNDDHQQLVLGVESSCDETGVGIIKITEGTLEIVADQVASSMAQHARFGGVVPEIASRAHLEAMQPVMRAALREAGITKPTAVAATIGPGLAGALLVGAAAAKAYAAAWQVPFYAVNHLGGHVAVDTLVEGVDARALDNAIALLVSGGHTQILHVRGVGQPMVELGSTLDDAAGEAYDKVARLLGLGYPGGPIIDRLAEQGDPRAIAFPRGMMRQQDSRYDFSFSGLKTAVARFVEQSEKAGHTVAVEDICASFQEAAVDVLTKKALRACEDQGSTVLLLGGGVSANKRLRQLAEERCRAAGVELHVPPLRLCTDNGVMAAALGSHLILSGAQASGLGVGTDPSLDVETPLVH